MRFCELAGVPLTPLSTANLARYIAYLSSFLAYNSIMQYLNIVRIVHEEAGFANPCSNSFFVSSVIKGAKKKLGNQVASKRPVTVDMLHKMLQVLDLKIPSDRAFFTVAVVAFFSFARIGNLVPLTHNPPLHGKHLCWCDVRFDDKFVILKFRFTKTIQYKQRLLEVPLPYVRDSPFSPASLLYVQRRLYGGTGCGPVFQYRDRGGKHIITYRWFLSTFKDVCARMGLDSQTYASHSFRRGGATLALSCNVPKDLIKIQGDWCSDAYQRYLDPSLESRAQVAMALSSKFQPRV